MWSLWVYVIGIVGLGFVGREATWFDSECEAVEFGDIIKVTEEPCADYVMQRERSQACVKNFFWNFALYEIL